MIFSFLHLYLLLRNNRLYNKIGLILLNGLSFVNMKWNRGKARTLEILANGVGMGAKTPENLSRWEAFSCDLGSNS